MSETIVANSEIASGDFLTIFVASALVLIFGGIYVGIFTAVKVKLLKNWMLSIGYSFWALTAYCLYLMGSLMHVDHFTAKALAVAALGLLIIPHAVYYMQDHVHRENELE